jgi:hypothetical protein
MGCRASEGCLGWGKEGARTGCDRNRRTPPPQGEPYGAIAVAYMCRGTSYLWSRAYSLDRDSLDILQAWETSPSVHLMSSMR